MTAALELDAVKKSFGGVTAVNGVSLRLEPGRIYGLIGPNGSGKTTLFNCVTGIERRDAGRILFQGERIDGLKPWQIAVKGVGRTFQVTRVFPELSALENLLVVTRGDRATAERRGRELLTFVKLEKLAGVPVGAFAVVVAMLAWRSRAWPLIHDAPIMHYIAWRIAGGAAPYRDVFDMNVPGVYVLHGAVLLGLGPGDGAWRLFDLGWLALGGALIAALAAPWGAVAAVGGALVFAAYHLAGGAWQAGQRDFLLCPFLLAGALGVARWVERRRIVDLAWGGLALGAGVTVKPHALVFAGLLTIVVTVQIWRSSASALAGVVFPSAMAVAPAVILLWLATVGALPAWRAIVLDYLLPLYSKLGRPPMWGVHRWHVWIPLGAAVVLSLIGPVVTRRFSTRHLDVGLGVLYGLVHYIAQAKGWGYHVYPLP